MLALLDNRIDVQALWNLRDALIEQWLDGYEQPPTRITLDVELREQSEIDAFDDPAHGQQQLTLFHGYYGQNQYLPIIWTEESTGATLLVGLRHGTCAAYLGADDDLAYIVRRVREKWPPEEHTVEIELRADCGFGTPAMYEKCEELGVWYTIGIGMNEPFKRQSDDLLAEAVEAHAASGQKQRLFTTFTHQAKSWTQSRQIVLKAEAHVMGTNRRAVVTNRPGAVLFPEAAYDEYVGRGESENRNKELKCDLAGDRPF